MTFLSLVQLVFLAFVVLGMGIVGTQSTWRGAIIGLAFHYLGVTGLLAVSASLTAGIVQVIVAAGVLLLLASDHYFDGPPDPPPGVAPATMRHRPGQLARAHPTVDNPVTRFVSDLSAPVLARPFDASVVALAAVGAIALAVTRSLFGPPGIDGAIQVLLIGGLLGCLLGDEARVAGSLLFIISAAGLALHAADPFLRASESLLLALTQLAFALVLIYLRSLHDESAVRGATSAVEELPIEASTRADVVSPALPELSEGS